ncbi:RNA polymerase sigma factor SigZ [Tumidithrix elongata RA019]|uniref:RNA polymerase sigma factor SigZ n=1 Tax=Tumidithrix elongata BACA0141 TaxID=2716417 RepID=A0AAW9PSI6_9CYAN|nr:RNA polymerase sigma factor SigZ [Tumidithrix elongata RA019]
MANEVNYLWQTFHHRLRGFILQRVQNPSDADDILQEVFLRIYLRLSTLRDSDRIVSWMFQITRNVVIDYYRSPVRQREMNAGDRVDLDLNGLNPQIEEFLLECEPPNFNREFSACLKPMLQELPESYREALDLVEIHGQSQRVAAKNLGLSLSGAKSRVQRGRQKLKALLLECCQVQLDARGNVLAYKMQETKCGSEKILKTSCC